MSSPTSKLATRLKSHFCGNGIFWGTYLLLPVAVRGIRSRILGLLLGAPGLKVAEGCSIRGSRYIAFGQNFSAGRSLWLEAVSSYRSQRFNPVIELGDEVMVSDHVHITCIEHIAIRRSVLIGSKVYISDHQHGLYRGAQQTSPTEPPAARPLGGGGPVEVGENVWIGDNVVILGPSIIGKGAIIAANSVVTGNVPAHTIVAGVPARTLKRFNDDSQSWEKT